MKTPDIDTRPRFGWVEGSRALDCDPQTIYESKIAGGVPVVVIPLPFSSPKRRKIVREFTKSLWPQS